MKISHKAIIASLFIFLSSCVCAWTQVSPTSISSPDGKLCILFSTKQSKLQYEVSVKGKLVISPSSLGLELQGDQTLGDKVEIKEVSFTKGTDSYSLLTGRASKVCENYNALLLSVKENTQNSRTMNIEARAYNDAIVFRYVVPKQENLIEYQLKEEKTEFRLSKDATTYSLVLPNYNSGYESEYHIMPITALSNQGGVSSKYLIGMPLVMKVPGITWAAIIEANLEGNAGTYLLNPSGNWTGFWFETVVSPNKTNSEVKIQSSLPHSTPWRVIMIADNPGHFAESNIITNLNPDNRIKNTSWIKSGKSAWDWWNGSVNKEGKSDYSTETMKYYVDFSAESGLDYMTIDAGWSGDDITKYNGKVDIPQVVKYAKSKGIKVFIWVYSKNLWNQMSAAFPIYESWGVAGIKTDFIERDDQAGIDFYYRVAEKAAQYKLMVDYHGCCKPWGIQRTFPNVVGYEGVLGMEQSKAGRRDSPEYHLIIPFTRMISGLMDYTPGGFDNVTDEEFEPKYILPQVRGSRAHHLAMYVVFESPLQMVSDWPERYRKEESSFQFIKQVPTSWDETRVLNGLPGEYITIVRRKGADWYLGAMNGLTVEKKYELPLSFLGEGRYIAEIYQDTPDSGIYPKKIDIKSQRVNAGSKLEIRLASAGGIAVYFKKE